MRSRSCSAALEADPFDPTAPGCYVRRRPNGFVAHFCASADALRALRRLTRTELHGHGFDTEAVDTVQLVVSELTGNAVRACGDRVPLVVEVYVSSFGLAVNVHDPDPGVLPVRGTTPLDSAVAERGRGLGLLDVLAPGWHVRNSAIGKQVRCRVPVPAR
ncbi:ATP-binding protein [Streptomyces sp. TRM70308]|uniref:ATP-binding protein n=1 Tax=Streptomyces TaxID=1883 RepID=UPI002249289D|nr:ATP-binding protein [Streptomyces sp. JHD 1]MCX2967450.1 ATP-binding protein [Streptomyces sp. JHD 1]